MDSIDLGPAAQQLAQLVSNVTDAQHAASVGLLKPVKGLSGIYDLGPLNRLLKAAGEPQVSP